jgi:uncharacterized protein (DUF1778 family)
MAPLRTERLQLVLTPEERAAWDAAALAAGESLSVWIRRACREQARRERLRERAE